MRRRKLLKALAATAASAPFAAAASRAASYELGVCSYSLRSLSRADAIAGLEELGVRNVNVKSVHLPYESSKAERGRWRSAFESAGLRIVGGGTIYLMEDDDEHIRRHFDYARDCGMPLIVVGASRTTLPRIERFAIDYDIAVAVHNHGPEDEHFPAPSDVLPHISGMDPRMGVCADLGHTARTGADVVEELAGASGRLLDIHMKDLRDLRVKESQCIVGEGAMPLERIFGQLNEMGYAGGVNLEYEIDESAPLPGMHRSLTNLRRVLQQTKGTDGP